MRMVAMRSFPRGMPCAPSDFNVSSQLRHSRRNLLEDSHMTTKKKLMRCSGALSAAVALTVVLGAQAPQEMSKVEIKTNKVTNNFYTLDGQGGTIGVLTGPDG